MIMVQDGIEKIDEYTYWNKEKVVDDYVFEFLRNKFPNSLILPEFNRIDWFVIDENLPIEIQSTIMSGQEKCPKHSQFEKVIRSQIEQNINACGICWFFFDADYLKYLQIDAGRSISVNYDWFYKLMKDEKLKVFTVTYDGKIEEKSYKDFDFIKRISSTCTLGDNQDSRILQRNKAKITLNVFNGNEITTNEMRELRKRFYESENYTDFKSWLSRKEANDRDIDRDKDRDRTIYQIYNALGQLDTINNSLNSNTSDKDVTVIGNCYNFLGLTEVLGGNRHTTIRRFVDKFNVAQYFPEYIRNKEKWDYLKESKMNLNVDQFAAIVTGKDNPLRWKKLLESNSGWSK